MADDDVIDLCSDADEDEAAGPSQPLPAAAYVPAFPSAECLLS